MSRWNNFGISVSDKDAVDDIEEALESLGLKVWDARDDNLMATDFGSDDGVGSNEVKSALRSHMDGINGFVAVNANDTSDTADGRTYKVENGSWERGRSTHSGGESTRRDWHGISFEGVRVDGGKY